MDQVRTSIISDSHVLIKFVNISQFLLMLLQTILQLDAPLRAYPHKYK